jgi:hypothetical protein
LIATRDHVPERIRVDAAASRHDGRTFADDGNPELHRK